MENFKINSRKLNKTLTFSLPGFSYIFVDICGGEGNMGLQICKNGELTGDTLTADLVDQVGFERICRRWYKTFIRKQA